MSHEGKLPPTRFQSIEPNACRAVGAGLRQTASVGSFRQAVGWSYPKPWRQVSLEPCRPSKAVATDPTTPVDMEVITSGLSLQGV